jgi:hypothetical protein
MSNSASITSCLIQLSAKGVQNTFLDLGPEFTFFKSTYKRHTNYAVQMSTVEVTGGQGNWGQTCGFTIPRNGDLLTETYMCGYMPVAGVDTTPCAYMKSNSVVVTNKGLHGPVKGAANQQFLGGTDARRGHHLGAISTVDPGRAGNTTAYDANGNPLVDLAHPLSAGTLVDRTPGNTNNGKVCVPHKVAEKGGLGGVTATSVSANKAAQFMAGNDFACVAYCNNLGHAMIQKASFQIGGNEIMSLSGQFMHIWHSLNRKSDDDTQDEQMLFGYGDGVGVPIGDNGSNAPQCVVEDTPPFFDPTNRYKLAQFELKFPKTVEVTNSLYTVPHPYERPSVSNGQLISAVFGPKSMTLSMRPFDPHPSNPVRHRADFHQDGKACTYKVMVVDATGNEVADHDNYAVSFYLGDLHGTPMPWCTDAFGTQGIKRDGDLFVAKEPVEFPAKTFNTAPGNNIVGSLRARIHNKTNESGGYMDNTSTVPAGLQVRLYKMSGGADHGFPGDPSGGGEGFVNRSAADSTAADLTLSGLEVGNADAGNHLCDLSTLYASLNGPRVTPLSSSTGITADSNRFATNAAVHKGDYHFDQQFGVHGTNPMLSGGTHNVVSFVALCDSFVGGNVAARVGDALGADDIALKPNSLGAQLTDISTADKAKSMKQQQMDADANTVSSMNTGTKDHVRGQTAHYRVGLDTEDDTATQAESSRVGHKTNEANAGHHLAVQLAAGDFVTTADYWNGTVGWTGANKRNIRDNFARRCQATQAGNCDHPSGSGRCVKVMVPLPFWFNRKGNDAGNAGRTQALPLIALQYHDCKIQLTIAPQKDMIQTDQEARNQPFRFTGCVGAGNGGNTFDNMHDDHRKALINHIDTSVLLPSTKNGGFCHESEVAKPTTFAGYGVTYGSRTKFFGGPNGGGTPYIHNQETELSCAHTMQGARTDLGARSFCLPGATGTGSAYDPKGDGSSDIIDLHLVINCVYLDSNERKLFASHTHEYLIQQVQESVHQLNCPPNSSFSYYDWTITLNLNHPTAVLFFTLQRPESRYTKNHFRYEATHMGGDDILIAHSLKLNSHEREGLYQGDPMNLRVVGPGNYFDSAPAGGPAACARDPSGGSGNNIYMYSFCQHPREAWPSGNLNFSRIDNATMTFRIKQHASQAMVGHPYIHAGGGTNQLADEIQSVKLLKGSSMSEAELLDLYYGKFTKGVEARVYAQSFNVLRLMSGMAAIKYAN